MAGVERARDAGSGQVSRLTVFWVALSASVLCASFPAGAQGSNQNNAETNFWRQWRERAPGCAYFIDCSLPAF